MKNLHKAISLIMFASSSIASGQVVQITDADNYTPETTLSVSEDLPLSLYSPASTGDVRLSDGLFRERRELTKAYILRLKTENILQNHLLEAGVRIEPTLEQMHQGWESPHYQLRGHFAGHWLSAAAHFAALDNDPIMAERVTDAVNELKHCQDLNKDGWVGSIPEKYFTILADGKPIWSPQYTLHKTMMGLLDAYKYMGDEMALLEDERSADWFLNWTDRMIQEGKGAAIYGGECAGMLELWADLYGQTGEQKFLTLASRYAMPDIFKDLLTGKDALSNDHANASIPWIQGAARLYEVTGDVRYRKIVEQFWKQGVEDRGMYATTGNNAGEFWVPSKQFGRFLGSRTQEHCTVYNMIRVAQYLFEWTGDARYADYIELALYNGILAQQNPYTGMVAYFLPQEPGAKKIWGTETHDFWCCHGTLVQAQAMYEDLIYYKANDGITVSQFIPSTAEFSVHEQAVSVTQQVDLTSNAQAFSGKDAVAPVTIRLNVRSEADSKWTLRIRKPEWVSADEVVSVNGKALHAKVSDKGFIEITRTWANDEVVVVFPKRISRAYLPGDESRLALLDGPVVLAALTDKELSLGEDEAIIPMYEHQYVSGREWQTMHYLLKTKDGTVKLKPVYEVADEIYNIYFSVED